MRTLRAVRVLILLATGGLAIAFAEEAVENPAPVVDRVGFPTDYAAKFKVIRVANKTQTNLLGTIYASDKAATITALDQLPYPQGSIIVMEWAEPLKGTDGVPLTEADGLWKKGKIVRLDVMRRESGYGAAYGEKRSGEWEFASYRPDGSNFQPPVKSVSCAACHQTATAARDFVFRGRFQPLENN